MEYDKNKTAEFWDGKASFYDKLYDSDDIMNHSALHFRLEIVKKVIEKITKLKLIENKPECFDAGCGSGVLLKLLYDKGFGISGCDLSEKMVAETKKKFKYDNNIKIHHASLDDLSMVESNKYDIVFCLGVLPYIPEEGEKKAYSEIHRILKPKGFLVSSHQNELFNLYSLNKYTLDFYNNYVEIFKDFISPEEFIHIKLEISKLISNHDMPKIDMPRNGKEGESARGNIFRKEENPLIFDKKLKKYFFECLEFFYYNFHIMPPSVKYKESDTETKAKNKVIDDVSRLLEVKNSQTWQSMFMCSSFLNVAGKININNVRNVIKRERKS